jgi:ice-binding like protein/Big-like domain-containing protein
VVALAAPTTASASTPTLTTASPLPPAGSIGLRLLDAPVSAGNDPRARIYIVDHLAPGTVIHRRIEVSNTTTSTTHVSLYPAAATIADGSFLGEAGHTANDLSSWTSVSPGDYDIVAGGRTTATVTISVPDDAAPGEQYGVVWAEAGSAPTAGGGITQVSRVGIRLYVSVGPGGPPAADFTIDSLTAARSPDGHPVVLANVHNTGGRALDMSGTLQLLSGPAGLRAGPFPAALGTTLAIGDTEAVTVTLDKALPAGPWDASITLHSGLLERSAHASITFPDTGAAPSVVATSTRHERLNSVVLALIVLLLLAIAILLILLRRRRRRRVADVAPARTHRPHRVPAIAVAHAKVVISAARFSTRVVQGRRPRRWCFGAETIGLTVALLLAGQMSSSSRAYAADVVVPLGAAEKYSVLGGTGVTSTGATDISADLGVSPASSVVESPPIIVGGQIHAGDPTAAQAHAALVVAYADAADAARTPVVEVAGDLTGQLGPGVYHATGALELTGTLTLNGNTDPNAVFIFQVGAALTTAAASNVSLIGGARASNVFWRVVGAAGIGASASFSGTIMASGAITVGAGAIVTGRVLSIDGAVTLAANTIKTPPTVEITGGAIFYTLDTTPTISGTADAADGTTVTVTVAGQTMIPTVQGDGGAWSVTAATVPDGMYRVVASVTGPAENTSTARQTLTVGETTAVSLGSAESYSVLSAAIATNTGITTHLTGDLGADSVVGFSKPENVDGLIRSAAETARALADLDLAYNDAAGRTPTGSLAADPNGTTLHPGVYNIDAAVNLTGILTLDGDGDPNAVFIFQVNAALNTEASSSVSLVDSAQASNVFWQLNGAAVIGASASFSGTIMAKGAITVSAGASLAGRALSFAGVTLASNIITTPAATGGILAITVPAGPVNLGTFAYAATEHTISGLLGSVQVDDTRGGSAVTGWVVSVAATAFTPLIAASSVSYSAGSITQIRGAANYTGYSPGDLSGAVPAVMYTGSSGDNAAATTWNPTIFVIVPGGAVAGVYTSTITHSVA